MQLETARLYKLAGINPLAGDLEFSVSCAMYYLLLTLLCLAAL